MSLSIEDFLKKLDTSPEQIEFTETIDIIDSLYEFTPTQFKNGDLINAAGENSGSCKLFFFAQLQKLDQQKTLACFGHYYRQDVLENPENTDHQNIRNFIKTGWNGIQFDASALKPSNRQA